MPDEHARWARRIELLTNLRALETKVADLVSQFTHKRLEEMTYEDLVQEADLTVELGRLREEMEPLLRELKAHDLWR